MVGEIRDSDTAVMATNAALTGHLVLTTIHTNDAPSAFTRLLEMNVEDFVVASTVNLVVAQRLIRRICDNCAEEKRLPEAILQKVLARKDVMKALEGVGVPADDAARIRFRIGAGCDTCLGTGYSGRIGMFEFLELTKEIHDAILARSSGGDIQHAAESSGFKGMVYDGVEKVLAGATTFDEIIRVTRNS